MLINTAAREGPEPQDLVRDLGRHGIGAEIMEAAPDYRFIGEQFLDEAREAFEDRSVRGAGAGSPVREMTRGGVTRGILERASLSAFITQ